MNQRATKEISCAAIIPAFNEQTTVGDVVRAAFRAELIDAVIVVDDGSTDDTAVAAYCAAEQELATTTKPFFIRHHEVNQGKAEAMQTGFDYAQHLGGAALRTVMFIDASPIASRSTYNRKLGRRVPSRTPIDIKVHTAEFLDLFAGYLDQLVKPVLEGEKVMTIGLLQRNPIIDKLRLALNWGALAGNRAVSAELWQNMIINYQNEGLSIRGWEAEAALNTYTRQNRTPEGLKLNKFIGKLLMEGVVNVGSRVKAGGLIPGLARMVSINRQAMAGFAKTGLKL